MKKFLLDILERVELFKRHFVNPEKYIPQMFKVRMGRMPNLDNPQTYNEKLCWM